jgi:hypothetical protein
MRVRCVFEVTTPARVHAPGETVEIAPGDLLDSLILRGDVVPVPPDDKPDVKPDDEPDDAEDDDANDDDAPEAKPPTAADVKAAIRAKRAKKATD